MSLMSYTLLMLSHFSGFLLYLYNVTGYKYFENGAEFKDLSITVTNHDLIQKK
jgi:hypothetical protein